jgi:hypothetical protein
MKVNFVQARSILFSCFHAPESAPKPPTGEVKRRNSGGRNMMQRLPMKLALTASLATLLLAIPVSIDLSRPGATDPNVSQTIGIGLKLDTAEARIGRPATPRSAAGVARRTTRAVGRVGPYYARPVVAGAAVAGTAVAAGATASARRCTTVVTPAGAVRRCVRVY